MKNIVQVYLFDMLSKFLVGTVGILLIRYMPENEYAKYTFAMALVGVISQTLSASFNRIYIIGFDSLNLKDASDSFLGFQFLIVFVLVCLTVAFQDMCNGIYWLVVLLTLASCLSDFSKTAFQQELKFYRFSTVELFRSALFLAATYVVITIAKDQIKAGQILVIQSLALLCTFFLAFRKRIQVRKMVQFRTAFEIAHSVITGNYKLLFGYFTLLAVFSQADIFMLRTFADDVTLATYGSAFRYYSLLLLSLGAIHAVLLPTIQKVKSASEMDEVLKGINRMLVVFVPVVVICIWGAQWFIPWIDKGKYPDAIAVFRILAASAVVSFAFSPYVNLVMRFERFRFLFFLIIVSLLASVTLNVILIAKYKAVGAALTTLITAGMVNISIYIKSRNLLNMMPKEASDRS
jgi:O-antigen/teichoic acid export membrane protein